MDLDINRSHEFVVSLPNRPGSLGKLAQLLGKEAIEILGFAAVGDGDEGTVHLVTHDHRAAAEVLEEAGYSPVTRDALIVGITSEPGELGRVASKLGQGGVNIEASFVTTSADGNGLRCAFSVDDPDSAEKILRDLASGD